MRAPALLIDRTRPVPPARCSIDNEYYEGMDELWWDPAGPAAILHAINQPRVGFYLKELGDLGLLGPDTTYIHCCYFSEDEWRLVADSGGTVSIAPQIEAQMGHGWPPVLKSMEYGLRPSLSIDVVTTAPGDIFTQMRAAFACDRARVNAAAWEAGAEGDVADDMLTARQMLEMATLYGAEVAGVADRTGSLTPGKQADVVVLDATALNMAPVIDPVAAVTNCADVSNVETVLIGGQVRKRDGKLVGNVGLFTAWRDFEPQFGDEPEMGWIFATETHGTGMAHEATSALLAWSPCRAMTSRSGSAGSDVTPPFPAVRHRMQPSGSRRRRRSSRTPSATSTSR